MAIVESNLALVAVVPPTVEDRNADGCTRGGRRRCAGGAEADAKKDNP